MLRGDSPLPADLIGHELTADGIARINGLSTLLGGATSFTDGNIILGGRGNDTIEGRGGNDFIDGDAWLKVQLSAGGTLHDSMLELQADVFSRALNPGDISIVRSIVPGAPAADADTAVFSGPRADYDITFGLTETAPTTVVHARNILLVDDGTDTLVNVEFLQFTDQTIPVDEQPGEHGRCHDSDMGRRHAHGVECFDELAEAHVVWRDGRLRCRRLQRLPGRSTVARPGRCRRNVDDRDGTRSRHDVLVHRAGTRCIPE